MKPENLSIDDVRNYLFYHKEHLNGIKNYNKNNKIKESIPTLNADATEPLAKILVSNDLLKDVYEEKIESVERKGRNKKSGAKDLLVNGKKHVEVKATYNKGGNSTFGKSNKESDFLIWIDGYPFFVEDKSYLKVWVFTKVDLIHLSYVKSLNQFKSILRNDSKSLRDTKYCHEYLVDVYTFKISSPKKNPFWG